MINQKIADFIHFVHVLMIVYIITGHYFTPIYYLKYYLLFVIFIFLDWNDFDGQCILTKLEHYFRTGKWENRPASEEDAPEFFRPIIQKVFNIEISRIGADKLNNYGIMMCLLLGFYRLLNHYNI